MVQRKMAAVNEPAGQTAVIHEAGDAPPKQEVSPEINEFNLNCNEFPLLFLKNSWCISSLIHL